MIRVSSSSTSQHLNSRGGVSTTCFPGEVRSSSLLVLGRGRPATRCMYGGRMYRPGAGRGFTDQALKRSGQRSRQSRSPGEEKLSKQRSTCTCTWATAAKWNDACPYALYAMPCMEGCRGLPLQRMEGLKPRLHWPTVRFDWRRISGMAVRWSNEGASAVATPANSGS